MANIAKTEYRIYGPEKDLDSLYQDILKGDKEAQRIMEEEEELYKFKVPLLINSMGVEIEEEMPDIHGIITYFSFEDEPDEKLSKMYSPKRIVMEVQSNWSKLACVEEAIHKKYPELKVYYLEEEYSMCIFETNDMLGFIFPQKYHIGTEDDSETFNTEQELIDYLNDYFKEKVCDDFASAIKFIQRKNRDLDFSGISLYIISRFKD